MPRLPIDYSKIIIYKICCNDVNIKEVYVGHTTDIIRRRQQHKHNCNYENRKEYNDYKYQFIRDNGGWENWSLVPVEEYPCENVNQACIRERYWIETLQASLNIKIPSRSRKEWCEINKEKKKEYDKQYIEINKDKRKDYQKEYYEQNKDKKNEKAKAKFTCECGSLRRIADKSTHFKTKKHQKYLSTINENRQESTEETIT